MPESALEAHLFICTNLRESGESCAARGSGELRDALKKRCALQHPQWKGRYRVNASGCLDRCAQGIAAVMYPEGKWYVGLQSGDLEKLERELAIRLEHEPSSHV